METCKQIALQLWYYWKGMGEAFLKKCFNRSLKGQCFIQARYSGIFLGFRGASPNRSTSCSYRTQSFPTSTWWLTTICNFSSRGSNPPFWSPKTPGTHMVHLQTCRKKNILICWDLSPLILFFFFFEMGLSLNMDLTDWSDWLSSKPPRSTCPSTPSARITGTPSFYVSDCPAGILSIELSAQPRHNF